MTVKYRISTQILFQNIFFRNDARWEIDEDEDTDSIFLFLIEGKKLFTRTSVIVTGLLNSVKRSCHYFQRMINTILLDKLLH